MKKLSLIVLTVTVSLILLLSFAFADDSILINGNIITYGMSMKEDYKKCGKPSEIHYYYSTITGSKIPGEEKWIYCNYGSFPRVIIFEHYVVANFYFDKSRRCR